MIILTGGKTGGHIIPLIAISKELSSEVLYIGDKDSLESKICKDHSVSFLGLDISNSKISTLMKAVRELWKKHLKMDAVLATGGYVSFPVLCFAVLKRIPIYLLEENVIMGRTNQFLALFAKKVFLSYPLPKMRKKYEIVGQPVLVPSPSSFKYSSYQMDILVIGGSLGSKPLCHLAQLLAREYRVVLVAGRYKKDFTDNETLKVLDYVDDLMNLMKQARLIISRAGASTTGEIFYLQKPCILIPSMKTKRNHQYLNALYFEKLQCAVLLLEKDAVKRGVEVVQKTLSNETLLQNMKENQRKNTIRGSSKIIAECIRGKNDIQ